MTVSGKFSRQQAATIFSNS